MSVLRCDVLVIGSGPAGLAAAYQARECGARDVLVLERNAELGGILPQCIHNGFGVRVFQSDLTGPEYVSRWACMALDAGVRFLTRTMVLAIEQGRRVIATSGADGLVEIEPKALVLAMGCRERPRGALAIPGLRPAGVYTAGTAQRLVNIEGYMPGERYVILGSGDIGMIMARRLTLEGARVAAMCEILPYVSGLRRNLVQCVLDYDIPLHLSTTVIDVVGRERVEAVTVAQVDAAWRPIAGTERSVACDTLLLSVGLIPENELSRMAGVALDPGTGGPRVDQTCATSVPGVYAAGNVVHVYDLVDDVTESALRAGRYAAGCACAALPPESRTLPLISGDNVHHVVPQQVRLPLTPDEHAVLELRVCQPVEKAVRVRLSADQDVLLTKRLRYVRPSEMIRLELAEEWNPRLAAARALRVDLIED
jgi:NADPH-dependent 2,4-dienoyl-CoA reductase/sulfur reductase-like enzyme